MQDEHSGDAEEGPPQMIGRFIHQPYRFAYGVWCERGNKATYYRLVDQDLVRLRIVPEQAMPTAYAIAARSQGSEPLEFAVRTFEAAFWWPLITGAGVFSEAEFRKGLEAGQEGCLSLFDRSMAPSSQPLRRKPLLPSHAIKKSSRSEQVAVADRAAADLIICGERVYIRGNEPTYICPPREEIDAPFAVDPVQVADPTSRRVTYRSRGPLPFGYVRPLLLRECARAGRVFRADELALAEALVLEEGGRFEPRFMIGGRGGRAPRSDPVAIHLAASLQYMRDVYFSAVDHEVIRQDRSCLEATADIGKMCGCDGYSVEQMFGALDKFRTWCASRGRDLRPELRSAWEAAEAEIEGVLAHCSRRGVPAPIRLQPEEELALENLARSE